MIQAKATDGMVVIGLSRRNCERLLKGKPIVVDLAKMGDPPAKQLVILAGETEEALLEMLHAQAAVAPDAKVRPIPAGEDNDRHEH